MPTVRLVDYSVLAVHAVSIRKYYLILESAGRPSPACSFDFVWEF